VAAVDKKLDANGWSTDDSKTGWCYRKNDYNNIIYSGGISFSKG
jgi:hypothetical protein